MEHPDGYGHAMAPYEVLDHTADTGISATGDTLARLVGALAIGMFELMAEVETCPEGYSVEFEVSAATTEDLVFEALSELLYRSEVEDLLFCDFDIEVREDQKLWIRASGVPTSQVELSGPPIKAVTYHEIEATETDEGWSATVYFDV